MSDSRSRQWLLLRGLARESAHWGEFVLRLQRAFPNDRVTTLDLPGTGQLLGKVSPSRIETIVNEVRQCARDQGLLERPALLVGISLGGMVAWQWLRQYPNDAACAVLINSSFAHLSPFYRRLRWRIYHDFLALLSKRGERDFEAAVLDLVSNQPAAQKKPIIEAWAEIRRQRPMTRGNSLRQLYAAAAYRPGANRPEQPVLLLNSAGDRLVSPLCSQAISRAYRLPLHTHPHAGHDLPLDDPDWVIEQVRYWLERDQPLSTAGGDSDKLFSDRL